MKDHRDPKRTPGNTPSHLDNVDPSDAANPGGGTLDHALRRGARQRRAWIDQQVYPVGYYPPRGDADPSAARLRLADTTENPGHPTGRRWWPAAGLAAAAALGLMGWVGGGLPGGSSTPPDFSGLAQHNSTTDTGSTGTWTASAVGGAGGAGGVAGVPGTAADWPLALVRSLNTVESGVSRGVGPAIAHASALPDRLEQVPQWLQEAEDSVQAPLREEWTALRADLQTATDYLRARWRPGTSPGIVPAPPSSGARPAADGTVRPA